MELEDPRAPWDCRPDRPSIAQAIDGFRVREHAPRIRSGEFECRQQPTNVGPDPAMRVRILEWRGIEDEGQGAFSGGYHGTMIRRIMPA